MVSAEVVRLLVISIAYAVLALGAWDDPEVPSDPPPPSINDLFIERCLGTSEEGE